MKIKHPLLSLALAVCTNPLPCDAVLMHAGASDEDHIALGVANSSHVLWVESQYQGTYFYYSAIRINDHYAITSGHAVYGASVGIVPPVRLGDGTNRFTDPGTVRTVSDVIVFPTYSGNSGDFQTTDIAVLRFSEPLPGANPSFAVDGSLITGQVVTSAGFGVAGFTGGTFSDDRNLRGWNAKILSEKNASIIDPTIYGYTDFYPGTVSLNGRGSNGDSGSPVYDGNGHLVGLTVGGTLAQSTQEVGITIFLDLTNPTIRDWIEATTAITPAPQAPQITLRTDTVANLAFSDLTPAREYRVMRSASLTGWQEAHRFTATSSIATWSEALDPGGQMFYRLEWNE